MYSNTASQPRLTLGQTTIQLGWDGSTLVDVTHYDNKYQNPLPAVTEHHLVISCNSSDTEFFICNIEAEKTIIKTVNLEELPTSVTFQGKSEEQFYVFYPRINDNVTDDLIRSSAAGKKTDFIVLLIFREILIMCIILPLLRNNTLTHACGFSLAKFIC
nr:uncharacterized protein LOC128706641 [Cherax quadricarinatus]